MSDCLHGVELEVRSGAEEVSIDRFGNGVDVALEIFEELIESACDDRIDVTELGFRPHAADRPFDVGLVRLRREHLELRLHLLEAVEDAPWELLVEKQKFEHV
jgi:hypothetical protein